MLQHSIAEVYSYMHNQDTATALLSVCSSVCMSVCLSHAGMVLKRLIVTQSMLHDSLGTLVFSYDKAIDEIPLGCQVQMLWKKSLIIG